MSSRRDSNLELLRVLSMLMIVANHFATKSRLPWNVVADSSLGVNLFFSQFLGSLGKLGADIFILISAWFMVGKPFRFQRLFKVWLTTVVIGVTILAFLPLFGKTVVADDWIKNLFPLTKNPYWFVTTYIPFIALIPFVLDGCQRLSQRVHGLATGALLLVYSVVPTILGPCGFGTKPLYGYSELLWFLILGVLASYLRRAVDLDRMAWWKPFGVLLGAVTAIACYTGVCDVLKASGGDANWSLWRHANSFFIVLVASSLLLLFAKMKLGSNPVINWAGSCVFGVYLIHDHPKIYYTLWHDWIGAPVLYRQDWYCLRALGAILLVFVSSMVLSYVFNLLISLGMRLWSLVKSGGRE